MIMSSLHKVALVFVIAATSWSSANAGVMGEATAWSSITIDSEVPTGVTITPDVLFGIDITDAFGDAIAATALEHFSSGIPTAIPTDGLIEGSTLVVSADATAAAAGPGASFAFAEILVPIFFENSGSVAAEVTITLEGMVTSTLSGVSPPFTSGFAHSIADGLPVAGPAFGGPITVDDVVVDSFLLTTTLTIPGASGGVPGLEFVDISAFATAGAASVVPEPTSIAVWAALGCFGFVARRRGRR